MTGTTTRWLHRDEGRIAYDVRGDGPLVVCIPAMGDLRTSFTALADDLAASGFRVASVDLRGHGESDTTFTSYDDEAAASDAIALIHELGGPAGPAGRAAIVGNSMGAGAAVVAAAEHPDAVSAVALVGPFVRDPAAGATKLALFRLALLRPWGRAVWRAYLPTLAAGRKPAGFAEHIAAIDASLRRPASWRAFIATTHTSHAPAEARLASVSCPVLVVMGEEDPDFPDPGAEAAFIAEATGGDVLLVPDAGHYPHAQRPDMVSPAIGAFLAAANRA